MARRWHQSTEAVVSERSDISKTFKVLFWCLKWFFFRCPSSKTKAYFRWRYIFGPKGSNYGAEQSPRRRTLQAIWSEGKSCMYVSVQRLISSLLSPISNKKKIWYLESSQMNSTIVGSEFLWYDVVFFFSSVDCIRDFWRILEYSWDLHGAKDSMEAFQRSPVQLDAFEQLGCFTTWSQEEVTNRWAPKWTRSWHCSPWSSPNGTTYPPSIVSLDTIYSFAFRAQPRSVFIPSVISIWARGMTWFWNGSFDLQTFIIASWHRPLMMIRLANCQTNSTNWRNFT